MTSGFGCHNTIKPARVFPYNKSTVIKVINSAKVGTPFFRTEYTMDARYKLIPLSPTEVARELNSNPATSQHAPELLLIDIRPNGQYCSNHIKQAENLNFSNILLRRLLKGVITLDAMISSPELAEKVCGGRCCTAQKLILCDTSSTAEGIKPELAKHAEVLCTDCTGRCTAVPSAEQQVAYFIDGGFNAFASQFPVLCEQTAANPARSPVLSVSVSTSLPISFSQQNARPQNIQLRTPSCKDESNAFGPPVELLPHLVLGCERDSANLSILRQMGITAVLNVSHNLPNHFESLFEYLGIPVEDSYQADLLSNLHMAFAFIDEIKAKNGKVFVHCRAGVSRSATVCIAYIMKHMGSDVTNAYEFVKTKRPCISPNLHFMGQLLEFQKQLCCNESNTVVSAGSNNCIVSSSPHLPQQTNACSVPDSARNLINSHAHSAPSSLHLFRKSRSVTPDATNCQENVACPFPSAGHIGSLPLASVSLPSTPVTVFKNHLPSRHGVSPYDQKSRTLHLHSPCRVAARKTECCIPYLSITKTL